MCIRDRVITGLRIQLGIVLAERNHSITLPDLPEGIRLRITYHPFCALLRPSNNCNSLSLLLIITRRSGSSGANTIFLPVAKGLGSIVFDFTIIELAG